MQTRINALSPQSQIDALPMLTRLGDAQTTANGCCDFIAQCILVRINHPIIRFKFIHLYLQRSTVVGSCGVKIPVL